MKVTHCTASDRIKKKTTYEWKVEEADIFGDIYQCHHWDTYAEAYKNTKGIPRCYICLVRDVWDDETGDLLDRTHAYVESGILEDFEDDRTPPKKYKKEVARFHERTNDEM